MADETFEVIVCLGSSCFARGNSHNLDAIEAYLLDHRLQDSVRLKGCLCQDQCKRGPNLVVRGEHLHDMTPAKVRETLLAFRAGAS